jgi:hypothetical protein
MEILEEPVATEPAATVGQEESKGSLCCSEHEGESVFQPVVVLVGCSSSFWLLDCALFCSTCDVSVCADCGVGAHDSHVLIDVDQAADQETDEITRWISNARQNQVRCLSSIRLRSLRSMCICTHS